MSKIPRAAGAYSLRLALAGGAVMHAPRAPADAERPSVFSAPQASLLCRVHLGLEWRLGIMIGHAFQIRMIIGWKILVLTCFKP